MPIEAYAPCPCGSGEKYKWCCHKSEGEVERVQRLIDNQQYERALEAVDEAVRKGATAPLLLLKKGVLLAHLQRPDEAIATIRRVVEKHPGHPGAQDLLVRLMADHQDLTVAVGQLQHALEHLKAGDRRELATTAQLLGALLVEDEQLVAGRKHLELAQLLDTEGRTRETGLVSVLRSIESSTRTPVWLKNPDRLSPVPGGVQGAQRERYVQGLKLADEGRWAAAAGVFDALSREGVPETDRNLGMLRLWLSDEMGAVASLRRYTNWVGANEATVDLESLCQLVAPPTLDDVVEHLQLIWPLRRRDDLLELLKKDGRFVDDGTRPIDPRDEKSPEVRQYRWLDRPQVASLAGLGARDVPRVLGRILVGQEIVALELIDDGTMAQRQAQFLEIAAGTVPPAHPKSKTLNRIPRAEVALEINWALPNAAEPAELDRLIAEEHRRLLLEVWPGVKLPGLRGKTPRQAAKDPALRTALRAAVAILDRSVDVWRNGIDLKPIRAELNLEPEPAITVAEDLDVNQVHLSRLHLLPIEELDDERLNKVYVRSRRYMLFDVLDRAARAMLSRAALLHSAHVDRVGVYEALAELAFARNDVKQALEWLAQGRESDTAEERVKNGIRWDLSTLRMRARSETPKAWVPLLATILEQTRDDRAAGSLLLSTLLELNLVRAMPNPDKRDEILIDPRVLQSLLARYGPKITTASGELAVSAASGGIWTPEKEAAARQAGGGGGIWTPGSVGGSPPREGGQPPDQPRLIIPGR